MGRPPKVPGSSDEPKMSEVEKRLEEALLFKEALKVRLFPNDDSVLAQGVEKKIKSLIRDELQVLMGMKKSKEALSLEDEEVNALKQIAKRLVEKKVEPTPAVESPEPIQAGPQVSEASIVGTEEFALPTDITLPTGEVLLAGTKRKTHKQVVPEEYKRPASLQDIADQAANMAQIQANNFTPTSGILGVAVGLANRDMIPQNFLGEEEEER
jgi:hypothetical protein